MAQGDRPRERGIEVKGIATAFRRSKHRVRSRETIVAVGGDVDPAGLVGATALWSRGNGLRLRGRVIAQHGNGPAVRVRWKRGFPPEGLGTGVTLLPKTREFQDNGRAT